MSALVTLSSDRVRLRRWHDRDRDAFAAMNCDARVMEFFRGSLSRPESDAIVDGILKHFSSLRLWPMGNRGPRCRSLCRFRRIGCRTLQRPFHALCGNRLASSFRALGTRLCDRGGPVGA
jgi:hypothetical protein